MSVNKIIFLCAVLLLFTVGMVNFVLAQGQQEGGYIVANEQKDSKNSKNQTSNDTSVDIHKLRQAESLLEIYELANGMHVGSVNDQRMLTKAVDEYMKKCCSSQDEALQELKKAKFNKIQNITEPALKRPKEFLVADIEFDKAVFSEYRAHIHLFGFPAHVIFYKVYLFFDDGKLVKSSAYIHQYELF